MNPAPKIWFNGKISPLKSAAILSFHQGLNYGACVYDGIRCYPTARGTAIFRLQEHIDRFFYSAHALGMRLPFDKKGLAEAIKKVLRANTITSGYIRPMAFYSEPKMGINVVGSEVTVMIFCWPWHEKENIRPVKMKISTLRRLDPRTVDIKAKISGYYANSLLAFLEAKKAGFDQPLFLDTKGSVAEGAVNNIFVIKRNILYTPDASNILAGITRDSVIAIARDLGFKVIEKKFAPQFLRNADEIFLTGTGIQLQEVSEIKEYFLRKKAAAPVTKAISDHYKKAAYGENKKFFRWLTMA